MAYWGGRQLYGDLCPGAPIRLKGSAGVPVTYGSRAGAIRQARKCAHSMGIFPNAS